MNISNYFSTPSDCQTCSNFLFILLLSGKLLQNHHVRNFFHFHTSTFDRRKTDTYLSCPLHQFKITQHSNVKEYFKAPAFRYTAAHLFSYVAQESDASHLRNREKICWKCR